jgi:tetratricopeptide (TPR) repeat protein
MNARQGLDGWGATLRSAVASLTLAFAACSAAPQAANPPEQTAPPAPSSALGAYLAARHAQQQSDYAEAAAFMSRALEEDPGNIDLMRHTFVLRVSDGEVAQAVPLAQSLVKADRDTGLAQLVVLLEQAKLGEFEPAAERAHTLPSDGAQKLSVPLLTAWCQAGLKRPTAAQRALDPMKEVRGVEALRDLHSAMLADYADRVGEAEEFYEKLVANQAHLTWRSVEMAGNFYERHQRAEQARRLYERLAQSEESAGVADQALARISRGEVPPRIVGSAQDGMAEALFDLASILDQRDTLEASLIYARLALYLRPDFPLAQMLVAEIKEDQQRWVAALAIYGAIDPKSPLAWTARLRAASVLDALDRTDEAVAALESMAAERPRDPAPLVEVGDILRGRSRFAEAVSAYDRAIGRVESARPRDWRLYYSRAVALERSGQWARAEEDLRRALELDPEQPMALNYLGYSWIDRGENLDAALKMIKRAVDLRPNDGYIVDSLGWAYYRLGDFAQATHVLEHAIELLPEDPTINDHLGDAYWQDGRIAEARFQWRRALQFKPEADEVKTIETKLDQGLAKPPAAAVTRGG